MTIKDLKSELARATTDQSRLEVATRINDLVELADSKIRRSSRDISYSMREWSIELILQKFSEGLEDDTSELFIPDYQREYKWSAKILSRFIESILLGFPIPYMYIADINEPDNPEMDGRIEIIDGSQRIRALYYFATNQVALCDLKEIFELEGFTFDDLNAARRRRFLRETLRLVELKGAVDEDTRRNLFERINSGTKSLEAMEVRKGSDHANSKFYKEVLLRCATDPTFQRLAPLSVKKKANQDHMELVLRFFAYANGLDAYDGFVRGFLDEYLKSQSEGVKTAEQVQQFHQQFDNVMTFVANNFPAGFKKASNSKTTARARYEALAIGVAEFLKVAPGATVPFAPVDSWIFSDELQRTVSADSSNNKSQLVGRIEYVKHKLLGA
jgi:hypothetical protein